jgi:hypothetical protein
VQALLPPLESLAHALVELADRLGMLVGGRDVLGEVDGAGLHDKRIDQAVDALDVLAATEGRAELLGQRRVALGIDHGDRGEPDRHGGKQREDRVELGRDRKMRQLHVVLRPGEPLLAVPSRAESGGKIVNVAFALPKRSQRGRRGGR